MNTITDFSVLKYEDQIDIRDVIARVEELEEQRKPWAAGWNTPGYMPDAEPCAFGTFEAAREYIEAELQREIYALCEGGIETVHQSVVDIEAAVYRVQSWTEGDGGETIGHYHYWIARAESDGLEPDESEEFNALTELLSDLKGYGGDEEWRGDWYPIALIRDSYFVAAMQELCEDIGDFPEGIPSYYVIDWEATARNLRVDYSSVEFEGVTYWYR